MSLKREQRESLRLSEKEQVEEAMTTVATELSEMFQYANISISVQLPQRRSKMEFLGFILMGLSAVPGVEILVQWFKDW